MSKTSGRANESTQGEAKRRETTQNTTHRQQTYLQRNKPWVPRLPLEEREREKEREKEQKQQKHMLPKTGSAGEAQDHDTMVSKCILHSIDFRVSCHQCKCEASLQRRDLKIERQCFYFYELLNNTSTSYCLLVVSVNVAITHVSVTISSFLT